MPVALSFNGVEVPVATTGDGAERAPVLLGEPTRALDGSLVSTSDPDAEGRSFGCTIGPMPASDWRAVRALIAGGRFVTLRGFLVEDQLGLAPGAEVAGVVLIGQVEWEPDDTPDGPVARYSASLVLLVD